MTEAWGASGHRSAVADALRLALVESDAAEVRLRDVVAASAEELLRPSIDDVRPSIEEWAGAEAAFNARLQSRWSSALDLYDLFLATMGDALGWAVAEIRPQFSAADDHKFEALLRLVSKAYMTAQEVRVLLQHGYSSGALARWRTIDEMRVISSLLAREDAEISRRYLAHHEVEAMQEERFFEVLWRDEIDLGEDQDADRKARRNELSGEFGEEFLQHYGWAAPLFTSATSYSFNMLRHFLLRREGEDDMIDTRAVYKVASNGAHANSRGVMFNIQSLHGDDYVWAGPSNSGLEVPAVSTTAALCSVFTHFIWHPIGVLLDDVTDYDDLGVPVEGLLLQYGLLLLQREVAAAFSSVKDELMSQETNLADYANPVLDALSEGQQTFQELAARVREPERLEELLGIAVERGWIEEDRTYRLAE